MRTFLKLLLLIAFCFSNHDARTQFRCDYTYLPEAEGWFKYHEIPSNWHEARLRCHMEGAYLASPLNTKLHEGIIKLMTDKKIKCGVYTGIHATFSRGDFASVEGVPLSKITHSWAKGEPDNYQDQESCLLLLPDGTMADIKCSETYPYFCYKKKTTIVVTECGTIDPLYKLDSRTGKCYKFHQVPRTWSRAYMNCMAEGAHLAIINSETEATVLKELFEKNPGDAMLGNFWKDVAFIGFHDWTEHGEWRTVEGVPLQETGYITFSTGEPNNATTGEYCGAIYRSALLDDLWCDNVYAFICEKEPNSLSCDDEI